MQSKKQYALDVLEDIVSDYLFYSRRGCEDLELEEMNELIESGKLTAKEISDRFAKEIALAISKNYTVRKTSPLENMWKEQDGE